LNIAFMNLSHRTEREHSSVFVLKSSASDYSLLHKPF
jgi:hypothetical protein